MPDTPPPGRLQVVALMLGFSAITLIALASLIYAGIVPVPEETRSIAAVVVGAAAFADLLVAMWFFRRGQSS
jgi:hypothetical protein